MIKPASRGMFLSAFAVCLLLPSPGFLYAADTTVKGTTSNSTAASLEVTNSSDTSLLYVRNDGNVGIGTSSPGQKLDVAGTLRVRGTAVNDALTVNSSAQVGIARAVADIQFGFDCAAQANFRSDILLVGGAGAQSITGSTYSIRGGGGYDLDFGANASTGFLKVGAAGNIIINDSGSATADVRMEGDSNTNLFFLDASADRIGIGTATPDSMLDVRGNIIAGSVSGSGTISMRNTVGNAFTVFDFASNQCTVGDAGLQTNIRGGILTLTSGTNRHTTFTAGSDVNAGLSAAPFTFQPTINRTDVAYKGLLLNVTESTIAATGNLLIDLQTGGVSQINFGNTGGAVFNENGTSTGDVRMEGDTDPNLFFLDASTDRIGIGTSNPTLGPLQMGSGAYVTAGGVWTNASSRAYKEDIAELSLNAAMRTLNGLSPITYRYKKANQEKHVGFIAEDVPELVATEDRKGLSPMDIAAVLTKVVQGQQKQIEDQQKQIEDQQKQIEELKAQIDNLKTEKR